MYLERSGCIPVEFERGAETVGRGGREGKQTEKKKTDGERQRCRGRSSLQRVVM